MYTDVFYPNLVGGFYLISSTFFVFRFSDLNEVSGHEIWRTALESELHKTSLIIFFNLEKKGLLQADDSDSQEGQLGSDVYLSIFWTLTENTRTLYLGHLESENQTKGENTGFFKFWEAPLHSCSGNIWTRFSLWVRTEMMFLFISCTHLAQIYVYY